MNKLFQFTFTVRSPTDPIRIIHHDTVEGDELVEVCSKIPLAVARAVAILKEYEDRHSIIPDDDIPF